MPAILQPTPEELKNALFASGWVVSHEDSYNWLLSKDGYNPRAVPKRVRTIPDDILHHCMNEAKMHGPIHLADAADA
jgi:hypothetical protein